MKAGITLNLFKDIRLVPKTPKRAVGLMPVGKLFSKMLAREIIGGEDGGIKSLAGKQNKMKGEKLKRLISELGGIAGLNLVVPSTHRQAIEGVLKAMGLKEDQCVMVLSKSTDKNGFIQLDKLWRYARSFLGEKGQETTGLAISKGHMAQLTMVLLRLGVSPDKMKDALEKHAMSKVEVQLKDITAMLNDLAPGLGLSNKDTEAILHQLNIAVYPLDIASFIKESGGAKEFSKQLTARHGNESSSKRQFLVKRALAQALREKGLPAEKVRRILEGLNVEGISENLQNTGQEGATAKEIESLLNSLMIKKTGNKGSVMDKGSAEAKILDKGKLGKSKAKIHDIAENVSKKDEIPLRRGQENMAGLFKAVKSTEVRQKFNQNISDLGNRAKEKSHVLMGALGHPTSSPDLVRWNPIQTISANVQDNIQEMAEHIKWMLTVGRQESRFTLHPPELGQMELRVAMRQGHLQVQLGAEHPWAKEIVEASLNNLRHQLTHAGFVVDKLEVTVGLGGGGLEAHSGGGERRNGFSLSRPNVSSQIFGVEEVTPPSIALQRDHTLSIIV